MMAGFKVLTCLPLLTCYEKLLWIVFLLRLVPASSTEALKEALEITDKSFAAGDTSYSQPVVPDTLQDPVLRIEGSDLSMEARKKLYTDH